MFTDEDFVLYLNSLEESFRTLILKATDLLNELSNESIHSKLEAISQDDLDGFRACREFKEKISKVS